jgi:hypothetical protein
MRCFVAFARLRLTQMTSCSYLYKIQSFKFNDAGQMGLAAYRNTASSALKRTPEKFAMVVTHQANGVEAFG